MTVSPGFNHYGRGPYKIIMPRVYSRTRRKEWFVNPSLLIFIVSVIVIFIVNRTLLDKNLYKITRTTVILPHTERVPEPTVPKSLPLLKVLKNAAKKSVETKKVELEKLIHEKPEEPKPVEKTIAEPLPEKKIEALKPLENRIEAKPIEAAQPLPKTLHDKTIIPRELTAKPLEPRDIPSRQLPAPNRLAPSMVPKTGPLPTASPAPANRSVTSGSTFNAMPEIKRNVSADTPGDRMTALPPSSGIAAGRGPKPELTQWESARPPVRGGRVSTIPGSSSVSAPIPPKSISVTSTPPPIRHIAPQDAEAVEEIVINSKALGSSDRVKILKQDIMKKARKLSRANSPYIYKVKGYTCTLTIEEESGSKKVIIDFSPVDAPFDVVSALERKIR